MSDHVTPHMQLDCLDREPNGPCRHDWMYFGELSGEEWADWAFQSWEAELAVSNNSVQRATDQAMSNCVLNTARGTAVSLCEPNDPDVEQIHSIDPNRPTDWRCTHPRCYRVFARRSDLSRHERSRHQQPRPFICPAKGCFKKQQRTAFPRHDKLVDHLRAVHDCSTPCTCPFFGCDPVDLPMAELFIHSEMQHSRESQQYFRRRLTSARGAIGKSCHPNEAIYRCPVSLCNSRSSAQGLPTHVLEHIQQDIESAREALQTANWVLIKGTCSHGYDTAGHRLCNCPFTHLQIRCPVCSSMVDYSGFDDHMCAVHFIDEQSTAHFAAWRTHCESLDFVHVESACSRWTIAERARTPTVKCPACPWSSQAKDLDHHFSMRQNLDYLKAYRLEILRLYPGFTPGKYYRNVAWGPVWDDLNQPIRFPDDDAAGPSGTQQAINLTQE